MKRNRYFYQFFVLFFTLPFMGNGQFLDKDTIHTAKSLELLHNLKSISDSILLCEVFYTNEDSTSLNDRYVEQYLYFFISKNQFFFKAYYAFYPPNLGNLIIKETQFIPLKEKKRFRDYIKYIKKKHPYREHLPRPRVYADTIPDPIPVKNKKGILIDAYIANSKERAFAPLFAVKTNKDLRFFSKIIKNLRKEIKRQKLNLPIKTDLKFSDFPEVLKFIK